MEGREERPKGIQNSLPAQVIIVLLLAVLGGIYPMIVFTSRETNFALVVATLLSTANVFAGYAAVEYSAGRSYTTMLKVIMGGMGIRLVTMLGIFYICIKVLNLPVIPLTSAMLSFYVVFLGLEILYIQKRFRTKNTSTDNVHSTF